MNRHAPWPGSVRRRLRLEMAGAVQGVGFRPFVHRLAVSERLSGHVRNTAAGVSVEVEGEAPALERFLARLDTEVEQPARVDNRRLSWLPVEGDADFAIEPSTSEGRRLAGVLPDLATCPDCRREVFDSTDRRHRYPFTTCVHCGPRYSIIESVPYDRARTTMRRFPMCAACQREYDDPRSRRFHAEANACPDCGPQLSLWDAAGQVLATRQDALDGAAEALRQGQILALKGLGGFQLLVDARNEGAVRRLRERKRRPAKPFALMVASPADASAVATISAEEQALLCSTAGPIVLLHARPDAAAIAPSVAPANPWLGVMLPTTPLHHLLFDALGFPVVATSGNRGSEPIVFDESEVLDRLRNIADAFLVHDRPILRPVDDSVVRVMVARETVLRLGRGYAPLALPDAASATPTLAVGGHQKNAVAAAGNDRIVLGPHIGDLDVAETRAAFTRAIDGLSSLHDVAPDLIACDAHPDYFSTHFAESCSAEVRRVPHHLAHVLAGILDNRLEGPVLGVAWDGTGYGDDGTIWGGEFLTIDGARYLRVAHLLPFRLPGGEAAMREPRRAAVGALYASFGQTALDMTDLPPVAAFSPAERPILARMLVSGLNSPLTSSAGRLFDAVAAILGLQQKVSFEGEAAMAVEFAADRSKQTIVLTPPIISDEGGSLVIDWRPMLAAMVTEKQDGAAAEALAAAFHEGLVDAVVAVAKRVDIEQVLLTGGCFQNAWLTERAVARLRAAGFGPHWHHQVPPNDGGLAVGQAVFAERPLIEEKV